MRNGYLPKYFLVVLLVVFFLPGQSMSQDGPDLIVEYVNVYRLYDAGVPFDTCCVVTATFKNIGNEATPGTFKGSIWLTNEEEPFTYTIPQRWPTKTHTVVRYRDYEGTIGVLDNIPIIVKVDCNSDVDETNEYNNEGYCLAGSPRPAISFGVGTTKLFIGANTVLWGTVLFNSGDFDYDPVPTGTFTFKDNGNPIAGCEAVAWGGINDVKRTFTPSTTGTHSVTTEYSGDGNYPPMTSQPIIVTVYNPPPVPTPGQSFSVLETAANGTVVGTVATTGGPPTGFSITAGNTDSAFAVSSGGQITVNNALAVDYEASTSFTLTVEATDGILSESGNVTVDVTDVQSVITGGQSLSVLETAGNGTVVGTVATGGDAPVGFSITGGNTGSAFAVNGSGQITVNDTLAIDYETSTSFTLTVQATDGTTPVTEDVTVNVTDVQSVITGGQSFSVSEAAGNGTGVGTVATSGDASVGFSITGGNTGSAFAVNSSGQITVNNTLAIDYDTSPSFTLTVQTTDGTTAVTGNVTVNVTDVQTVITGGQSFSVSETAGNGTGVGTVATGGDAPVGFSITGGNTGSAFAVSNGGQITVNNTLAIDYDTSTSFTLTVQATDGTTSVTGNVTVNVTDVQTVIAGGQSFSVSETAGNGTGVGTVVTGGDAPVGFSITGGNTGSAFAVSSSGQITVNNTLAIDYETSTSFTLTVQATDGTTPVTGNVTVNVTDVQTVIAGGQSFSVLETTGDGTGVGTVVTSGDAPIGFSITGGNTGSAFAVSSSGQITVNNTLAIDYDTSTSFTLTVQATDGTTPVTGNVTVNVTDDQLEITAGQIFSVSETAGNGTGVGTVATSGDAPIGFSITGGNTGSAFAVDSGGQITVNNTLAIDYETSTSFTLTVQATDGTTPVTGNVTVNVTDDQLEITAGQIFSVSETAGNGTGVGTVATSGDAPIGFSITGGNTGSAFAVDSGGQITVNNTLAIDYETSTSFTLIVQATDGTTPVTGNVTVNVTNELDPSVFLSVGTGSGDEDGTTAVEITAVASANVIGAQTLNIAVSGTNITAEDYSLSSTVITLANGTTSGCVTFTVQDDALVEGTETATLTLSNPSYGIILGVPITRDVTITDNDSPGFTITEADGSTVVSENGSEDTFTVVLTGQPATDVVFDIISEDMGKATVSPAVLAFTHGNWNVAQTETVAGIDNASGDGNHTANVIVSIRDAASNDLFDPLADQTVTVTIIDDDAVYTISGIITDGVNPVENVTITFTGGHTETTDAQGRYSYNVLYDTTTTMVPSHGVYTTFEPPSREVAAVTTDMPGQNFLADDGDGISTAEEMGPDGNDPLYDGNNDGVPDCIQTNAASLHSYNGECYVTLACPPVTTLAGVAAVDNPSPANSPGGIFFACGFFAFMVNAYGESGTTVTLYLPEGSGPNTYWKYGPEPGNAPAHWYEFMFDGQTGAVIEGNKVTLYFVDGLRGDDDLLENGVIVDQGGPGNVFIEQHVPTIRKWGMVIFGIFVLALAFIVIKRGKRVTSGIG